MAHRARAALVAAASSVLVPVLLVANPTAAQALDPGQLITRTIPRTVQGLAGWDVVAAAEGLTGAAADAAAAAGAAAAGGASIGVGTGLAAVTAAGLAGAGVGYAAYNAPGWAQAEWARRHAQDPTWSGGTKFDWTERGYHAPKGSISVSHLVNGPNGAISVQGVITAYGTGYISVNGGVECSDGQGGQGFSYYGGYGLSNAVWEYSVTPANCPTGNIVGLWALSSDAPNEQRVQVALAVPKTYRIHTHLDCIADDGVLKAVDTYSAQWIHGDDPAPAPPAATCPAGTHVVGVDQAVEDVNPDPADPDGGREVIYKRTPDPRETDVNDPWAKCLARAGSTPCTLATDPGYDPTPDPVTKKVPDPKSCTWGGIPLPVTECTPARQPGPGEDPAPDPTPSPGPIPGGAGQPTDADGRRCFPSGWSMFNPVQWVLRPLTCAFIPTPGRLDTRVQDVQDAATDTAPGKVLGAVGGWVTAIGTWDDTPGDCHGLRIPLTLPGHDYSFSPFDACAEPTATVATYSRTWGTIAIWLGAGLCALNVLAGAFGIALPWRGDEA